jgi:hypothetical protein
MSVKLKKKPAPVGKVGSKKTGKVSPAEELAKQVDAGAHLDSEVQQLKALLKEKESALKKIKSEIEVLHGINDPEAHYHPEGAEFIAQVGAEGHTRKITDMTMLAGMLETIQPGLFAKIAKVNLSDLDKYLTHDQQVKVIETETNGRRVWKFLVRS